MSGLEITCLKSFLDFGHRVVVFAYDQHMVPIPFGTEDAATILPRERLFTYLYGAGAGSPSAFSNLFRYLLLERHGDWWIDSDVLCLTSEWTGLTGQAVAGRQDDESIGTAVLALPPALAASAAAHCEKLGHDVIWGETGPVLMTRILHEHRLAAAALPPSAFYPVHYLRWSDPFDRAARVRTEAACAGAVTLHLWHEMIRRSGLDKSWLPPADTYFGQAVRRHRTEEHFAPVDEEAYRLALSAAGPSVAARLRRRVRRL